MSRVDSIGRKIGYNWWREYNCEALFSADQAWMAKREAEALGYETEEKEYAAMNPRPTLKRFLLLNAGAVREESYD